MKSKADDLEREDVERIGHSGACVVRDRRFVEPCAMMRKHIGVIFTSWNGWDFNKNEATRTFIHTKKKVDGKVWAINCCPWCGTRIDGPFVDESAE